MSLKHILAAAFSIFVINAYAAYPDKSIKFLVPWPPGGATDQVARLLVQPLSKELGVSVFVENKGGAGGNIGTQAFVQKFTKKYNRIPENHAWIEYVSMMMLAQAIRESRSSMGGICASEMPPTGSVPRLRDEMCNLSRCRSFPPS